MPANQKIRWAPKVRQEKIQRLYENDARGLIDEILIQDVGIGLYLRCKSVLQVSSGQVPCPHCATVFAMKEAVESSASDILCCPCCAWATTRAAYHTSWRHQDLIGTNDGGAFAGYVEQYPKTESPRERMLLIDRLIHAFHLSLKIGKTIPHRSAANNLIEGSHEEVVAFLDRLTYGEGSHPETQANFVHWHVTMEKMQRLRGTRSGD